MTTEYIELIGWAINVASFGTIAFIGYVCSGMFYRNTPINLDYTTD